MDINLQPGSSNGINVRGTIHGIPINAIVHNDVSVCGICGQRCDDGWEGNLDDDFYMYEAVCPNCGSVLKDWYRLEYSTTETHPDPRYILTEEQALALLRKSRVSNQFKIKLEEFIKTGTCHSFANQPFWLNYFVTNKNNIIFINQNLNNPTKFISRKKLRETLFKIIVKQRYSKICKREISNFNIRQEDGTIPAPFKIYIDNPNNPV